MLRRIDEVNDLAEQVHRHLPIVENIIESQNSELRSRARAEANLRAELEVVKAELAQVRQQLDALLRESGRRPNTSPSSTPASSGTDGSRTSSGTGAAR